MAHCDALACHTDDPGRITRPYGAVSLRAAQEDIADWMRAAGMSVRVDAIGNVRGRYEGLAPDGPALLLGSHYDSVRNAGRFDGPLGILAGIAAVARLATAGRRLPFPVEVVAFPDEEGLRFQTTYLGSCALAGVFDPALLERVDAAGITLRDAILAFGGDPAALAGAALAPGEAFGYIELHIEQGPTLEAADVPIGVVTAISGQTRVNTAFTGAAGHAGTVTMPLRRDPLPAAAELILVAEALARQTPGLLATVGQISADPGATNVIPGRVECSLDVRHPDDAQRRAALETLRQRGEAIAASRALLFAWQVMRDHPATSCDQQLADRLGHAVAAAGQPVIQLPSGAGHDAVVMAQRLPVAMLFVRCAGGVSHNPAESVSIEDVAVAIEVLDRFLDALVDDWPRS